LTDPLFFRSELAIEESVSIREQRRLIQDQFDHERRKLRAAVFESATSRAEIKASRDNDGGA
jgi:hypothetical protein